MRKTITAQIEIVRTVVKVRIKFVVIIKIKDPTNIIDDVINVVRELLKLFVKRKTSFVILDKISHVVVLSKYLIGNLFIFFIISHLI
jgi:hypothetical protein